MSWLLTRIWVDNSSSWSLEFTNVSGGSLNTEDFNLVVSTTGGNQLNYTLLNQFANIVVPDGGTFTVGDSAEAQLGGSGFPQITIYDFMGISDSGLNLIDGVGDRDSSVTPFAQNTIYTALGSRTADTNETDASAVGTEFTTTTYCFAAGTLIATPDGEVCVETLKIGDRVMTECGEVVAVKWLGRQTMSKWRHGAGFQPVCIRAGALGNGVPHTDLTVTGDHGMIIDGLVVNAGALVNGDNIDWVPMAELPERAAYYHVETERHDVILANGAPAETFIDYANRADFDNYQEYVDLYGAELIIPEMPRLRISSRRQLPAYLCDRFGIGDYAEDVTADALAFLEANSAA